MNQISKIKNKKTLWSFLIGLLLFSAFIVFAARLYLSYRNFYAESTFSSDTSFIVKKGEHLEQISSALQQSNLINDADNFNRWTKIKGEDKKIKAGEYAIPAHASPFAIMKILTKGEVITHKITIPEGLTTAEIIDILNKEPALINELGEDFSALKNGNLLPSTYHFSLGDTKESIIRRMQESFNRQAEELWQKRQKDLPFNSLLEAVTLASLVEKEAILSTEKPLIASVFINRLKKGMKLQSDPTVLFALSEGKSSKHKRVLYKDLEIDSPYNTYKYTGLPPTPICNIGMDTLEAVLNPADTNYLYFVVDMEKPNAHTFSATYKEHSKNVDNFRKKKKAERQQIKSDK